MNRRVGPSLDHRSFRERTPLKSTVGAAVVALPTPGRLKRPPAPSGWRINVRENIPANLIALLNAHCGHQSASEAVKPRGIIMEQGAALAFGKGPRNLLERIEYRVVTRKKLVDRKVGSEHAALPVPRSRDAIPGYG